MDSRADSVVVTRTLFQEPIGSSILTSAQQLVIREVKGASAAKCYELWHYLGTTDFLATHHFGVFHGDELLGCLSFGVPNAKELKGYWTQNTQKGWWELKRMALAPECPKNSESRSIAFAIRCLKKTYDVKGVITYADDGVGHVGTIYKASGFTYLGLTAPKSDFYGEDGKVVQRGEVKHLKGEWRPRSRKHLFVKQFKT